MSGKVKKLIAGKDFGFIKGESGQEYFFHQSDFMGDFHSLEEGTEVNFEAKKTPKGLRAANVILKHVG